MNIYEKIKSMTIDEMAEFLTDIQINVLAETQKKLVYCLPLPKQEEIEKMIKDTIESLKQEVKSEE